MKIYAVAFYADNFDGGFNSTGSAIIYANNCDEAMGKSLVFCKKTFRGGYSNYRVTSIVDVTESVKNWVNDNM